MTANKLARSATHSFIDFAEGGTLLSKREYLRMTHEQLVFDICAAPFGTAYFFSCRFAQIPAVVQPWELFVFAIGLCALDYIDIILTGLPY